MPKISLATVFTALQVAIGLSATMESRPNLVVVLADDLGYGDVSCYNWQHSARRRDGGFLTPNVDRLAETGMRFTNAHSPSAVCTPTRYGFLTGNHCLRIKRTNGVQTNYNDVWIPSNQLTLPGMLRAIGYTTMMAGKWHLGFNVRDSSGNIIRGKSGDKTLVPDWKRPLEDGPTQRGFDYSFGHLEAVNGGPYKMF